METLSLVVGIVAIVLAIVAIWLSTVSERRSSNNYERTKDVLAEVDKKAAVIEGSVNETQRKLVDAVTSIVAPKEPTMEEKMMAAVFPAMLADPESLQRLIELGQQQGNTSPPSLADSLGASKEETDS